MDDNRKRGRPRKDPEHLATWVPPADWSRLVVWISAEERKALKRVALEADTSVAQLVRALANGLSFGVITSDELLKQIRKGFQVMEKIPTIFDRGDGFKVVDQPRKGCEWVFAGEGRATEKLDGTNVRLTIRAGHVVRVEKRRNPSKLQKQQGVIDGWYVDADEHGKEDKWIFEAVRGTDVHGWPDGEHSVEALGPSIQGNLLGLAKNLCVPFNLEIPAYEDVPRSFDGLKAFLEKLDSRFAPGHLAEGIVFHHPDGRRAKIKRKDFGHGG
ncbi:hypothetical protein [Pendulispora albinea]|uniref:RNA ligase family protein n=1 Tax=Pendulispora albinea TaxID=2741071 RepID=A0ABZ2M3N4_9BACT